MLAINRHFSSKSIFRRIRRLPVAGRIFVRVGQVVSAMDDIAEIFASPRLKSINLSLGLGISPKKVETFLQVGVGDLVLSGGILAGPVGFRKRVVRSPEDGRVVWIEDGLIFLEMETASQFVKTGWEGRVVEVIENQAVVIEMQGTIVQGTWANGKIGAGKLTMLARSPFHNLALNHIHDELSKKIVVAGYCDNQQALQKAAELPLSGLILSSLSPSLATLASQLSLPLMLLEGFGKIPLNARFFQLFTQIDNCEVILNAEAWNQDLGLRPELMIPMDVSEDAILQKEWCEFAVGQMVHITSTPYLGRIGQLVKLLGEISLPNGVFSQVGEVLLGKDERLILPLANLEVIELK